MDSNEVKGVQENWQLKDIKVNKFVRVELDHNHVLYLRNLHEAGEKLKPIIINRGGILIDGRHRVAVYQLLNKRNVDVKVVNVTNEPDIIALAYKLNCGGSKPPSPRDTEHTVVSLLNHDVPKKEIAAMLGIPMGLAMRYITSVQSRQTSAKLRRASDLVLDSDVPLQKAALTEGVPKEKLQQYLKAAREKKRDVGQVTGKLTSEGMSYIKSVTTAIKQGITMYEEGEITDGGLNEIMVKAESLNKSQATALKDWRSRVDAKIAEGAQGREKKVITFSKTS